MSAFGWVGAYTHELHNREVVHGCCVTPWPGLVKRVRFLSSLKQDDLAQHLGVDQGTVSRWERGTYAPDIPVQKRLRDMLHRLEPAIGPAAPKADMATR